MQLHKTFKLTPKLARPASMTWETITVNQTSTQLANIGYYFIEMKVL